MTDRRDPRRDEYEPEGSRSSEGVREPMPPGAHEPKSSHAGNGTVKHGLDGQGPDGLDSDELNLRTMLHDAVRQVEPSDGTLEYLRRAVPARRARKRQALVGMAAATLFLGAAVPALVHVSRTTGSDANPSTIGHASQAQGGTGEGPGPGGGETTADGASNEVDAGGTGSGKGPDKGASSGTGTGATEGAGPSSGATAQAPACTATDLGQAVPSSTAPDSTGTVYGSFRVANVSTASCTVTGPGTVGVTPAGAADASKVSSQRHVAGDAAAGLPDPSLEVTQLVLKPGEAYEVKFAWVPSETCPTPGETDGGSTGGPTPGPSTTENPTTNSSTSAGGDTGTSTQLLRADQPADGSVTVTYAAATGTGEASATVNNACAGAVYWTGLLTAT